MNKPFSKTPNDSMTNHDSIQMLWLKKVGAVLLALTFWQIAAMRIHSRILLVTPIAVIRRLFTIWKVDGFFSSIWFTFYHISGGFLLGLLLGILLAFMADKFSWLEILFWPWMVTIKSVPVASFIVICLVWLSVQNLSIFISFLIVLPIIYQNVLTGLKSIDREMEEMAQIFRITPFRKLRYITVPHLRPYLLSACTVTAGMAWKSGVAAEIIGTPAGSIGKKLFLAKTFLATDDLLAWTVIIVAISVLSEKAFLFIFKKILGVPKGRAES